MAPASLWNGLASSTSGSVLAAVVEGGGIYISISPTTASPTISSQPSSQPNCQPGKRQL